MKQYENNLPMQQWSEDDRPDTKLLLKGKASLSDAELLSLVMGSGSKPGNSLDVARLMLSKAENNLAGIARMNHRELSFFVTRQMAIRIISAFELGRRRADDAGVPREKITRSEHAFQIFQGCMSDKMYEEFWIILLNKANRVLGRHKVSEGGISGTTVDPKKIFKIALDNHASSIILGHNHPSGNLNPSVNDEELTKKIVKAAMLLDMAVLDHIILGDEGFYSFADAGKL